MFIFHTRIDILQIVWGEVCIFLRGILRKMYLISKSVVRRKRERETERNIESERWREREGQSEKETQRDRETESARFFQYTTLDPKG